LFVMSARTPSSEWTDILAYRTTFARFLLEISVYCKEERSNS